MHAFFDRMYIFHYNLKINIEIKKTYLSVNLYARNEQNIIQNCFLKRDLYIFVYAVSDKINFFLFNLKNKIECNKSYFTAKLCVIRKNVKLQNCLFKGDL